ncbi:MAG: UMP kinase [Promethearchaeia archaeon]
MNTSNNIVIKIGGSLLFDDDKTVNLDKIREFCGIIGEKNQFDQKVIICGGGIIAREYIDSVRTLSENEALCDLFGIDLSRMNAKLLISGFGELAYPLVPHSIEELSAALLHDRIVVMGGLQPGQSTTSVACEVAEFIKAKMLVILTDVQGIYDKDPKKYSDATLLDKLTYSDLQELILNSIGKDQAAAGEYRIFDTVSLQILKRSEINTIITSGLDLGEFKKFWTGQRQLIGTQIID